VLIDLPLVARLSENLPKASLRVIFMSVIKVLGQNLIRIAYSNTIVDNTQVQIKPKI